MIIGTVLLSFGFMLSAVILAGWPLILTIVVIAFGEMMASPRSQEYTGRIASRDQKALYMGYYFICIALGNLFGGILSGQLYGHFACDLQRPDIMWLIFGALGLMTVVALIVYKLVIQKKKRCPELGYFTHSGK